jgi:large subunit ribosomal protein L18
MTKKKIGTVNYRRKRTEKTDYNKRLSLLKSKTPRLVVRKTNKNIIAQIVEYSSKGDKVLSMCNSSELEKFGWKMSKSNMSSAYLTGLLLSKKTSVKKANLDIGLQTPVPGSKIFSVLKGCIDGGLNVPYKDIVIPNEDRIKGKHISSYAKLLKKNDSEKFKKIFTKHLQSKMNIEEYEQLFEKTKQKILAGNKK